MTLKNQNDLREALTLLCERGNLVRATTQIDSTQIEDLPDERRRTPALYPILDCPATVKQKRAVPISLAEEERYIKLVERFRTPTIRDRVIVSDGPAIRRPR